MDAYAEISPRDLRGRLEAGPAPGLVDVREPWEHALVALPGAKLIPMPEIPGRVDELPAEGEVVVYCHHGLRAAAVVHWLRRQGIRAVNLRGGIDAWAAEVDPTLRRY
jgi:rhodanese-related sulfurtransferase